MLNSLRHTHDLPAIYELIFHSLNESLMQRNNFIMNYKCVKLRFFDIRFLEVFALLINDTTP